MKSSYPGLSQLLIKLISFRDKAYSGSIKIFYFSLLCFSNIVLFSGNANGQLISTCPNSNFSLGNFNGWVGTYGSFSDPELYQKLDTATQAPFPYGNYQCYNSSCPPLHSIQAGPGKPDPNTGDSLISVFPGEAFSAKLGHDVGGSHAAQLKYSVYVDNSTYLFIYRYAVVLENPGHSLIEQPSFTIAIEDSTGKVIDSTCGYYYIASPRSGDKLPPTWHRHLAGTINWKEWTTVGMDLEAWLGHHLTIVFTTRDCSPGGHFGYAYVSAYCSYLTIQTSMCQGDSTATLTAPPGFATYLWSTGDTAQQIIVKHPITGDTINCRIKAVNGCTNIILNTLTYTSITTNFTHGTSCSGVPIQFNDSSYVTQNAVTGWKWNFGDGTPVVTGIPNPQHTFALPGIYNVKLVSHSTEGCKDSITKPIVVDSLPLIIDTISRKQFCSNSSTNIIVTSNVTNTLYTWTASSSGITGFSNNAVPAAGLINDVLVNNGTQPDSVTYLIYAHRGLCVGPAFTYVVLVFPKPVVTSVPATPVYCSNQLTNILLTSGVANTSFTWTAASDSLDVTGFGPGSGNLIAQTINQPGYSVEYVTYAVAPTANSCPGNISNIQVLINPKPHLVTSPMSQTICSNDTAHINLISSCPGTNFTWTSAVVSGNVSGNTGGAGTPIKQKLTNNINTQGQVDYTIHFNAGTCLGNDTVYSVFVNPKPNVSTAPLSASICSNTSTNISLQSDVALPTYTWSASGSSGNVSGFSNGSGPSIIQTLNNIGPSIETVTYKIVATANGCHGDSTSFIVTVHPLPIPVIAGSPSVCKNSTTAYSTAAGMSNYSWVVTGGGIITSGGTTNTINVNWPAFGAQTVSVIYTDGFGCTVAVPTVFNVMVTNLPIPTLIGNINVCINNSYVYTTDGSHSGYVWTVTPGGTIIAGGTSGDSTITINWSVAGVQTITVNYQSGPGCLASIPTPQDVTVNNLPTQGILSGNNPVCKGSTGVVYTAPAGMTGYIWAISAGGTITSGGTALDHTATVTWNTAGVQSLSLNYTDVNGCIATAPMIYPVTVNPLPTATIAGLADVCQNAPSPLITFTGALATAPYTFTYNINGGANQIVTSIGNSVTVAAPTNVVGPFIYNLVSVQDASSTTCSQPQPGSVLVTVHPLPTATIAGIAQVCQNSVSPLITFTGASSTAPYTFTYNINGGANQIVTSVGNSVTVAAPTNVVGSFTYNLISVQDGSGTACSQAQPGSAMITVNPLPTATISGNLAVCQNAPSPMVTFTGASSTAPYTFTYNINGGANQLVTTLVGNSINIAAPTTTPGTYVYNLISVKDAGTSTCSQNQAGSATITIDSLPIPSLSGPLSVCANSIANYATEAAMTNYNWTISGGGVITAGAGTNNITVQWGAAIGTYSIQVNYHNANGCTAAAPTPKSIIVNTLPVPAIAGLNSVCSGLPTQIYSTQVGMSNYSWIVSVGGSITAGGATTDNTVTVLWNTPGVQTVSVNYVMGTGCTAPAPIPYNIIVKPRPVVTNAANSTLCSPGKTSITPTPDLIGSTFSWIATGSSGNVTGFNAGAGSTIADSLKNTGFNIEFVDYVVTPSLNGCDGTPSTYRVFVNPVANVTFTPNSQTLCSGLTTGIALGSGVAGTTFSWTATGSSGNILGFGPGAGFTISQILTNSGLNNETATYHVSATANSCLGKTSDVVATVAPSPVLAFSLCTDVITTTDAVPFTLNGGIPLGGTYSGSGVNAGIFYPGLSGAGTITINYSYSNTWGCNANQSQTITVINAVPFNCDNVLTDLRDGLRYNTVKIGTQCWMAQNLNFGTQIPGSAVQRDNCVVEKYCYSDIAANCPNQGGFYQWDEMMRYQDTPALQGVCPPGWHVPSEADWSTLFNFYTSNGFAGSPLKYSGFSGFNAVLNGTRFDNSNYYLPTFATFLWSSTSDGINKAWAHAMNDPDPSVSSYPGNRSNAFNVRCIKN